MCNTSIYIYIRLRINICNGVNISVRSIYMYIYAPAHGTQKDLLNREGKDSNKCINHLSFTSGFLNVFDFDGHVNLETIRVYRYSNMCAYIFSNMYISYIYI